MNDISVEKILLRDSPRHSSINQHNPGVYLVSYADGPSVYLKNQNALVLSAINKGIDFFLSYRKSHIDKDFKDKNSKILNGKVGAGYWLWKPWVIYDAMKMAPEGAVIIYSDTGFVFSSKSVFPLIELAYTHDITLVEYDTDVYGPYERIANLEFLDAVGCNNDKCRKSAYTMAGFMVLKNNKKARAFIKNWLNLCQNKKLLVDIASSKRGHDNYSGHQFDQTLLNSLHLSGKHKVNKISELKLLEYLTWHHRKGDREDFSLIHYMKKGIRLLEKGVLNFVLVRKFRDSILFT